MNNELDTILLKKILLEQRDIKNLLKRNQKLSANFLSRLSQILILVVALGIGAYAFNFLSAEAKQKQAENWIEKIIIGGATYVLYREMQKNKSDKEEIKNTNNEEDTDLSEEIDKLFERQKHEIADKHHYRNNNLDTSNIRMEKERD